MNNEKITIPEDVQQVCRDFAKVAIKHGLYKMSGNFSPSGWGADVSFSWNSGRHNEDSDRLSINSTIYVHTNVNLE